MASREQARRKNVQCEVDGTIYDVQVFELPFREEIELCCTVGEREIRVSDLGYGFDSALRVLGSEIRKYRTL